MFLVSHDIYCSFCPSPCFTNWFPLTWGDSTIIGNTETRNSFFFPICRGIFLWFVSFETKKKIVKAVFFVAMFSSKRLIFLLF